MNISTYDVPENDTYSYKNRIDWAIPVTINAVLTTVTIWILISLIHYGIKTKKWRNVRQSNHEKLNAGAVYASVLVCSIMCLLRYAVSMTAMNTGFGINKNEICDKVADFAYCSYALVLFTVAAFLWFRQRTFFINNMLNVSYKVWTKILSFLSIFLIAGLWIFVLIYNTTPMSYRSTKKGCIYQPDKNIKTFYWMIAAGGIVAVHLGLVGLFAYALLRVKATIPLNLKIRKRFSSTSSKTSSRESRKSIQTESISIAYTEAQQNPSSPKDKQTFPLSVIETRRQSVNSKFLPIKRSEKVSMTEFVPVLPTKAHHTTRTTTKTKTNLKTTARESNSKKIKTILTKTFIFALVSILCDVFIQVFANYIIDPRGHRRLSHMVFDINSFLNLIFIVFSFDTAKQMLTFSRYF